MIKFEYTEVVGWEHAIRGMRNPLNSWAKSDSDFHREPINYFDENDMPCTDLRSFVLGQNDHDLMTRLRNAGTDHRKFMRMITVYVDITAPLYWWKEFDTYKVGTVANSCSTMHKIAEKEFTRDDFSDEHLIDYSLYSCDEVNEPVILGAPHIGCGGVRLLDITIQTLNFYRQKYLEYKTKPMKNEAARKELLKKYWWQMIQLLPSSYNQKRTVMLNYEVLANIYKSRKNHKLDEWSVGFIQWIESLPYSELITAPVTKTEKIEHISQTIKPVTVCELCNVHGCGDGDEKKCKVCQFYRFSKWANGKKINQTLDEVAEAMEKYIYAPAINKILGDYQKDSESIEHLVDVTCSWDLEHLNGMRLYVIGPGYSREDLTPYELRLLEISEAYWNYKKEKGE